MPNELAERDPMQLISAAIERGMAVNELGQLFDLQRRWSADRAAEAFAEALTGFQADCPMVQKRREVKNKDRTTTRYKFAGYEDVLRVAQPHLAKHRIAHNFSTPPGPEGQYVIVCHLRVGSHAEDRSFTCDRPNIAKLAEAMYCNEAQAVQAWESYRKRAAFCNATGLVVCDEDTDMEGAIQCIGSKQIAEINGLLEETGTQLDWFLKFLQVDSLDHLPITSLDLAIRELTVIKKRMQRAGKGAAK